MFDDIIDFVVDTFEYIFSFEWIGDLFDFIGSMFENLSEISVLGMVFGLVGFATIYIARDYMLNPFLLHMSTGTALFWMIATYIGAFAGGYLVGNHFQNS